MKLEIGSNLPLRSLFHRWPLSLTVYHVLLMIFLNYYDVLSTIIICPGQASEEELAEVEAATKPLLDTKGGILPTCYHELGHAVWRKCGIP